MTLVPVNMIHWNWLKPRSLTGSRILLFSSLDFSFSRSQVNLVNYDRHQLIVYKNRSPSDLSWHFRPFLFQFFIHFCSYFSFIYALIFLRHFGYNFLCIVAPIFLIHCYSNFSFSFALILIVYFYFNFSCTFALIFWYIITPIFHLSHWFFYAFLFQFFEYFYCNLYLFLIFNCTFLIMYFCSILNALLLLQFFIYSCTDFFLYFCFNFPNIFPTIRICAPFFTTLF